MAKESVYDSRAVANYFIGLAGGAGLDSLQVLKLTYIAHGFVLGARHKPLLEDDVEAWQYGPVVRRIYKHLPHGSASMRQPITDDVAEFEPEDQAIIDDVYRKYGSYSGLYLSSLTHRPGSPWRKTWDEYGKNAVIPQDLIERHYALILTGAQEARERGDTYTITAL